jgi:dTDP-4-amino-4,6-dideoxygalactose transaminase
VLKALGLQGEVILPSFTFFATGEALLWTGLRPVFADCRPGSWTIDPSDVARKITKRTSAILAVHLYGNPCDVDALTSIATAQGLKLIFDAAHAFGSEYAGAPVGSFGDAEVFSLSPTKLLVAGEGGLVCTNDALLARKIRAGRNYGDLGAYNPELLGLNARMSEFNAALAIAGLDGLDRKVRRHQEIARLYGKRLAGVPGIRLQEVRQNDICTFKDYSIHISPSPFWRTRDSLAGALLTRGIQTKRYFYPPLHKQTLFSKFYDSNDDSLRVTEETSNGILSLPIYQALPNSAVKRVADAIGG